MGNWLFTKEADFVDLCGRWALVLSDPTSVAAFDWNPAVVQAVLGVITAFLTARERYLAFNTTENRIIKDEKKAAAQESLRDFADTSVRHNKNMGEAAKAALGVHSKKKTRTRHGAPKSVPDVQVETTPFHYQHRLRALNLLAGNHSKPPGAHGVRYAWQLGGERPAAGAALPRSRFSQRTSIIIPYTEADKGKTVYYSICYENRRGDQGEWSPLVEAVIG